MSETTTKKTLWIALTAIFTALTTVATIILAPPLPKGFFNFGEAVIYLAALLLGPITRREFRIPVGAIMTGMAGGIGAMFGDILLAYYEYSPATFVLKFFEGFVAAIVFKRLKAGMTQENVRSGKTTMRVLMSGFLIAAAVIIIGVNFGPQSTILWILIGSFFIVTVFVTILRGKIPIYYMVISMLAGGVIRFGGYFVWEGFVLAYIITQAYAASAFSNLPWNIVQALVGVIAAIPVYYAVQKAGVLKSLYEAPATPEEPSSK